MRPCPAGETASKHVAGKLSIMLRRMISAPTALAHYALGSCYVLAQLALYERNAKLLTDAAR